MKNLLLFLFSISVAKLFAQVGNGASNPYLLSSVKTSTTYKEILIFKMIEFLNNAIVSPANELLIYKSVNKLGCYFFNGTIWSNI